MTGRGFWLVIFTFTNAFIVYEGGLLALAAFGAECLLLAGYDSEFYIRIERPARDETASGREEE